MKSHFAWLAASTLVSTFFISGQTAEAQFDLGRAVEGALRGSQQFDTYFRSKGRGIENHVIRERQGIDFGSEIVNELQRNPVRILSDVMGTRDRMPYQWNTGGRRYENPYCEVQPVRPAPPTQPVSSAEQYFALAQQKLKQREYRDALKYADKTAELVPDNADVQQLRSLILMNQGRYRESAGAAYAALAAGPGWNWKTLVKLYGSKEHYVEHYNGLTAASKHNPESADLQFLLAYHYLMLGHLEAGRNQLTKVLQILPNEQLSVALLQQLPEKVAAN